MAYKCEICGKGVVFGNRVSHSNKKSSRKFRPNIKRVRVRLNNGTIKRMNVCTTCIKSGKVQKPIIPS